MHAVLMGDPAYFHIAGGANPFTRNVFGFKKKVDRKKAVRQWENLKNLLTSLGVAVHVIPPDPKNPGLVYPANAGVLLGDRFVLSNLIPSRSGEQPVYKNFLEQRGCQTATIQSRFEGEADFFPVGNSYVFTFGQLRRQRFVPRLGLPPWKRIYGFRTNKSALAELQTFLPLGVPIHAFELARETHYHGDTVFCSFGPERKYLLAWLEGLTPESAGRCRSIFGENLISIGREDAFRYAANSFQVVAGPVRPSSPTVLRTSARGGGPPSGLPPTTSECQSRLIMPEGVSDALLKKIEACGVTPHPIDVSEFLKKGGGAVKCMIGDLTPSLSNSNQP